MFVNRGVLRITTLNHKRSILLLLISQKLKTIHREAISLAELYPGHDLTNAAFLRWREKFYSQAVLQEIGQITNTEIRTLSKDVVGTMICLAKAVYLTSDRFLPLHSRILTRNRHHHVLIP